MLSGGLLAGLGILHMLYHVRLTLCTKPHCKRQTHRRINVLANAALLMSVLLCPISYMMALGPLNLTVSITLRAIGLIWALTHAAVHMAVPLATSAMEYTLTTALHIIDIPYWVRQYPRKAEMILVSVAALGTVCWQLAMASPAGPILIIALSTHLKSLTLLPQIVNRANLAVHACMIVGSILPQENSTNTVIALVLTPITLLIWNPLRAETCDSRCAGPEHTDLKISMNGLWRLAT